MTPLETLLARLLGARKAGNGWSARCPAHEDRKASLSISKGDDGAALVKCHAGCDKSAILSAVRLTLADLFPRKPGPAPNCNGKPKPVERTFPAAVSINGCGLRICLRVKLSTLVDKPCPAGMAL